MVYRGFKSTNGMRCPEMARWETTETNSATKTDSNFYENCTVDIGMDHRLFLISMLPYHFNRNL